MSLTADLAAVLHKIIDDLGPTARHDELHAEVDAAAAEPEPVNSTLIVPEPDTSSEPETPSASELHPDPDTPAPVFGTESEPHGAQ